jgi:hypothetical protein
MGRIRGGEKFFDMDRKVQSFLRATWVGEWGDEKFFDMDRKEGSVSA